MGEMRNTFRNLTGKPEGKRPKHVWEDDHIRALWNFFSPLIDFT
jgi:hypothetical protein